MTEQHPPLTDIKLHIYQVIDQFPTENLPEVSRFLEHILKMVNTSIVNQSASNSPNQPPQTEQPWLKYTSILKDSPNWDEFLEMITENRREESEVI